MPSPAHLEDVAKVELVLRGDLAEGARRHEQQHRGQAVVHDDRQVVHVHAAHGQHRVAGFAAVCRLQGTGRQVLSRTGLLQRLPAALASKQGSVFSTLRRLRALE